MKIDAIATDYLGRVRLRVLEEPERERFDQLLETRHYLKSSRIGGRHLRYVAEVDGEWVALLAFSGAAPHLKGREKWIGWRPRQQARRLVIMRAMHLDELSEDEIVSEASEILLEIRPQAAPNHSVLLSTPSSWMPSQRIAS